MLEEIQEISEKYEVLEKMGQGGMGAIYRVRHRILDEIRVIKTILPNQTGSEESRARFLREARVAAQLRHPNIAALYDCSITSNGTAYMVMEYISGMNLYQFLGAGLSLDADEVRSLSAQVLDALEYLHDRDIIHRDISTDNLMLTEDDKGRRTIKLIDLGLAKSLDHTDFKTRTGVLIGKMTYVSPEQLNEGSDALDGRSDLYSFAIVLYQLLTGKMPIVGQDQMSLMAGHLHHPPKSFDETDPDGLVPSSVRAVVLRALEKDPDNRYQSAREFKTALLEWDSVRSPPSPASEAPTERLSQPPADEDTSFEAKPETPELEDGPGSTRTPSHLPSRRLIQAAAFLLVLAVSAFFALRQFGSGAASGDERPVSARGAAPVLYGTSHALVIGNNDYVHVQPLKSAVNDARQIAELLEKRYGFSVNLLLNATRDDMVSALYELQSEVTARDSLLVYYAGHGELFNKNEYWLPIDAGDDPTSWISTADEVTPLIDEMAAKHVLMITDSCYSGASQGGSLIEAGASSEQLSLRPSRLVLSSGSLSPVVDLGRGGNSIFASSLLDVLRRNQGTIEISEVFAVLEREVPRKAEALNAEQVPSLAPIPRTLDGGGGFFFALPSPG